MLHSNPSMVRQRIYRILADYQNDHEALRSDPAFKLVCDRLANGFDLASQPTLSQFQPPRGRVVQRGHDRRPLAVAGRAVRGVPRRLPRAAAHHASTWMRSTIPRMVGSS